MKLRQKTVVSSPNEESKKRNFIKPLKPLFKYINKFLPFMILAILLVCVGTVLNLLGPNKLGDLTNEIAEVFTTGIIDMDSVMSIGIFLIIIYALGALFNIIESVIMTYITQRVAKNLRRDITKKINRLPLGYLDSHSSGDIMSRVSNDIDTISQTLSSGITTIITSVVMLVGSMIMMFITNWIMALCAIASSLIGFGLTGFIMAKSQKHFVAQQRSLGELNGHIEETYSGHDIVKVYNGTKSENVKFDEINNKLYKSGWKSQFLSGLMMPLMNFIGNFGYVVVAIAGALLVANGMAEIGVISAFIIYIRLFTMPMGQMAQALTYMQSTSAASARVFEFINEAEMEDESYKSANLENVKGEVEFKNVKFGYDKEKPIIKDFSLKVEPGQKVAIVGPTGAGKTTLVNLLMRFYEIDSGHIYIDGVDTKTVSRDNVHNQFSMVLQDSWIFEGTVKDNIIYDKKDVTDEQVVEAAKACGIDHFIRTLPNGYDTVLDDNTSISIGQKQLFTIARAMVQNGPMLILDEATSSVDTRTEILIQKAMDKLMKGRTSFVIAHRLSTIKNADIIIVLKDGDIVETGNHKNLIAKGGFYADLYNSQFESNEK